MKRLIVLATALLLLQFTYADEGTGPFMPPMSVDEYRMHIVECKAIEDSLRSQNGTYTQEELKNPAGDMTLDERNGEMIDSMLKCLQIVLAYTDNFYKDGKITEAEYNEAYGRTGTDIYGAINRGEYSFGRIAGETFSTAVYTNCKALVKYYLDSARLETNPERKDELYEKAMEVYSKCLQTALSDLVDDTIFETRIGMLGENDDEMSLNASIVFRELCEGKINRLKEKIAKETDPIKKIELYREMQNEIIKCTQFSMSDLVDNSSEFADWANAFSGGYGGSGLAQIYAGTFRSICEIKLSEAKKKVDAAKSDGEREAAREEYAKVFVECVQELEESLVPFDLRQNPFDYMNLGDEDMDAVQKACAEKIEEVENERKKPKDQRSDKYSGYNDYGLESLIRDLMLDCGQQAEPIPVPDVFISDVARDIVNLSPDRFSPNAGAYTFNVDDAIRYGDLFGPLPDPFDTSPLFGQEGYDILHTPPSPGAIISMNTNNVEAGFDILVSAGNNTPRVENPLAPQQDANALCDNQCEKWDEWNWAYCSGDGKGGGVQTATRERNCNSGSTCSSSESKTRECTPNLPADITVLVNGNASATLVVDKNNAIKIKLEREVAFPVSITIKDNTALTAQLAEKDPACLTTGCTITLPNDEWNNTLKTDIGVTLTLIITDATGLRKEFEVLVTAAPACTENWSCGNWGTCSNGQQARTCTDSANCGTTAGKPSLTQACESAPSCTENWSCTNWVTGSFGSCQESGTQTRTDTRTCTDANNCGTTTSKPATTQNESQSCNYTPTDQKPEYTSHEQTLGSNIATMNWQSDSKTFDTSGTGGEYGYKILDIPPAKTVKICISASVAIGYNAYPQYHYGYDWSTPAWESSNPGCITAYNKNSWANGILLHLGDPAPVSATGTVTISEYS